MPFVFLVVGIVFVASGVRGTSQDLLNLLTNDLKGPNNFIYWVLAIAAIGGLGYVADLRSFSRALLALVLIVLILAENKQQGSGGLFVKLEDAVKQITGG
jgi:type IV secretory pathway VirB2 component (pilin)